MIPLIQEEIVNKNKWLDNEEFLDTIAIAQSAPGVIAINSSVIVGYKLRGVIGAFICALGVALPSFFIILIVAKYLFKYRSNATINKVFLGIRPAVVALISSAVYKLIKASKFKKKVLIIPIIAAILISVFNVSPIYIILIAGLGGVFYSKYTEDKNNKV